jgi:hypothetical protein
MENFMRLLLTKILIATAVLFVLPHFAWAESKLPKQVWVVVTHPVLACNDGSDGPELRQKMLDAFLHPNADGTLPEGCAPLKVGDKYLLDDCLKDCVPAMSPVFAPPRRLVGAYLRPTKAPKD